MKSFRRGAATVAACVLIASPAAAAPRRALLVGSREGSADQATLRYTADDVHRLANALRDLGGTETTEVNDVTAEQLGARLDALAREPKAELFVFYYSGHAGGANLSLGATSMPIATVLAKVAAVPADLRIVVLDACQSGAATRSKGVTLAPPVAVTARTEAATGDVVITSSSASEASYESDVSRAGVFSLHFATGLRGAADENGDGAVTIGEAYRYAYAQTLRATLLTTGGPQHPTFRWALEGQREPVLTRLATAAHLTLKAAADGDFILFDERESRVQAEVRVDKDKSARLALAPGKYVVRKRSTRDLRTASISLGHDDDRVLEEGQMPAVPLVRLPPKGGLGNFGLALSAGQTWSALGDAGHLRILAGPEWERSTWLFRAEASFSVGTQEHLGLETTQQAVGVLASALTGFRAGAMMLRAGPLVGTELVLQQPTGRGSLTGLTFVVGPRLRIDAGISRNLSLYSVLDVDAVFGRVGNEINGPGTRLGSLGIYAAASYGIGLAAAW